MTKQKKLRIGKEAAGQINNLYHPSGEYDLERFDAVEILDCINVENRRFLPVLLKEAFSVLKKDGLMLIEYSSKLEFSPDELEKTFWWLFQRKYEIVEHKFKQGKHLLTIKKTESTVKENDDISHWTFGMVTNGERRDFIKKSIDSIRALNIPSYEIIICGNYPFKIEKDIRYIPFSDRDDRGWITRKKNIIAENAKYNNVCIFHDRIVFDKNWYMGMKKYGNNFEVLSCPQILSTGERVGDWVYSGLYGSPGFAYTIKELDYKDWDKGVYIGGQLIIIKKNVWSEVCLNETLYWKEAEDIEYAQRLVEKGFIPRFNPYSICHSLSWNFGKLPRREFTKSGKETLAWKLKNVPLRRFIRSSFFVMSQVPMMPNIIHNFYLQISKTNIYKFVINH
ncbi:MAG: hypothetical protein Q7K55_07390 [Candidatus Levybacteria bacterium]|nr:hypothetical protein [Candidatus Levybacteria bacterium]